MFIRKHLNINNILIDEYRFDRELNMESFIMENPDIIAINDDWLGDVNVVLSEAQLLDGRKKSGKKDGRIDLIATYNQDYLAIVELKKGEINMRHLDQLEDYLNERDAILKKHPDIWDAAVGNPKWLGVIIGNEISSELMNFIGTQKPGAKVIPIAAIVIKRFRGSDKNVYTTTDVYFNRKHKQKDYSKYIYKGESYNKGRLTLAVIKDYVYNNPSITIQALKQVFPSAIETLLNALQINSKGYTRYFTKEEEIITLKDGTEVAARTNYGAPFFDKDFVEFYNKKLKLGITKERNTANSL
jgi:hypothetical protein